MGNSRKKKDRLDILIKQAEPRKKLHLDNLSDEIIRADSLISFNRRILSLMQSRDDMYYEQRIFFAKVVVDNFQEYLSSKFNRMPIDDRKNIAAQISDVFNEINIASDILEYDEQGILRKLYVGTKSSNPILQLMPNHYYLIEYRWVVDHINCRIFDLGTETFDLIEFTLEAPATDDYAIIKVLPNTCANEIDVVACADQMDMEDIIAINQSAVSSAILIFFPFQNKLNYSTKTLTEVTGDFLEKIIGFDPNLIVSNGLDYHYDYDLYGNATGRRRILLCNGLRYTMRVDTDFTNHFVVPSETAFNYPPQGSTVIRTPIESYSFVYSFIYQACHDSNIKKIYMTLYRISDGNPILDCLIAAANRGCKVKVYIELNARGEEIRNWNVYNRLKAHQNVKVITNFCGMKVHAKMFVALGTDENENDIAYSHISTGNYNFKNAQSYLDVQFITCRAEVAAQAIALFKCLGRKSFSCFTRNTKPVFAPTDFIKYKGNFLPTDGYSSANMVKSTIMGNISAMIHSAESMKYDYRIILKCNHLMDRDIIDELLAAAKAGINIDLIVRTSFNQPYFDFIKKKKFNQAEDHGYLRLHRAVGIWLEHDRVYIFETNLSRNLCNQSVYISSADLMYRNLYNRAEMIVRLTTSESHELANIIKDYTTRNQVPGTLSQIDHINLLP